MYLFVPCDKKSHGTEISFPIRSSCLSHPHPLVTDVSTQNSHDNTNHGLQTIKMIFHFVFLTLQFLLMIEGGIINVLHQENVGGECHIDPDMCRNAVSFKCVV